MNLVVKKKNLNEFALPHGILCMYSVCIYKAHVCTWFSSHLYSACVTYGGSACDSNGVPN